MPAKYLDCDDLDAWDAQSARLDARVTASNLPRRDDRTAVGRSSHRFRRPGLPEIEHGRKYEIELSIFTPDVLAAAPRS